MPGDIIIYALFTLTVVSSVFYFYSFFGNKSLLNYSRRMFYTVAIGLMIVSVFFWVNIFTHIFQYTYIWENSSKGLPNYFLFASFFAGQLGSYLLLALIIAVFGLLILPELRRNNNEALPLGIFSLILVFLVFILVAKSPLEFVWDTFSTDNIQAGFIPEQGKGLNPIFENFWITVHSPVLFIGYAAVAVPFVLSVSGLIRKEYTKWIESALPWALFAAAVLGLAILMGGLWSYETLGQEEFWSWDPVENASLIPWLAVIALTHTLKVQNNTGRLIKTNIGLAILSFILVLYAAFLTRSGILSETSDYTFLDPGDFVHSLLAIMLLVFSVIGFSVFILRFRDIPTNKTQSKALSKEFFIAIGSLLLLSSALIIFIATTWPVVSAELSYGKISVEKTFFNSWNIPIFSAIMFIAAISLYLKWGEAPAEEIKHKLVRPIALLIVCVATVAIAGISDLMPILLISLSLFSIIINVSFLLSNIRRKFLSSGIYLSHLGLSILILGIVASGEYSKSEHLNLRINQSQEVFGHRLTFIGKQQIEHELIDRKKTKYLIKTETNGSESIIDAITFWSDFNQRQLPYNIPGIHDYLYYDLYITTKSTDFVSNLKTFTIRIGENIFLEPDSSIFITLLDYDFFHSTAVRNKPKAMGTVIRCATANTDFIDTLFADLSAPATEENLMWENIDGTNIDISFIRLNPNHDDIELSEAVFALKQTSASPPKFVEILSIEATKKPLIIFVWLGVIMIIAGFLLALLRHKKIRDISI